MLKFGKHLLVLAFAMSGTPWAMAQDNVDMNSTAYETMQIRPRPGRPNPPRFPERPGRPNRPGRISYVTLGSQQTQKILTQTFEFDAYNVRNSAYSVRLVGLVGTTNVQSVQIELWNGRRHALPELAGSLRLNRVREAYLGGERVRRVIVTATSGNLTGSRAQFRVDLGLTNSRF